MMQYQSKDLFQLQIELVDSKVENATNKAMDRVIDRLDALKSEIHELKIDMNIRFNSGGCCKRCIFIFSYQPLNFK
jgi:hypothetical protein